MDDLLFIDYNRNDNQATNNKNTRDNLGINRKTNMIENNFHTAKIISKNL